MASTNHKTLSGTDLHTIQRYSHATAAAREAESVVAADIGKISQQADDASLWALIDNSPLRWDRLNSGLIRVNYLVSPPVVAGTYPLGISLPTNAYIVRAFYDVISTFTSATDAATIGIGVNTDDASGIVAPTAISAGGNVWDSGAHDALPDNTAANFTTKSTATRTIDLVVAVESLTAGELNLFIEYAVSD